MEECPNMKFLTRFIAHQYQAGTKDYAQLSQLVFNELLVMLRKLPVAKNIHQRRGC